MIYFTASILSKYINNIVEHESVVIERFLVRKVRSYPGTNSDFD